MVIEWFMFGALGFFLGCLLGLMLAPPLWNRAVKLTTRRLEATMPMTLADIQADKDQQRAEFAIQLRRVEVALEKSKEKASRELIEANKRKVEIQLLKEELKTAQSKIQENDNANRVLQQTIKRRLPDLDQRLKGAKKALVELENVNAELRNTVASQSEALKVARATVHNQRSDIDRLRLSLESGSGRGKSAKGSAEAQRLAAELSRTQEELEQTKISTEDMVFLRRELKELASQIMNVAQSQPTMSEQMVREEALGEEERSVQDVIAQMGNGASHGDETNVRDIEQAVVAAEMEAEDMRASEERIPEMAHAGETSAEGTYAEDAYAEGAHPEGEYKDAQEQEEDEQQPEKTGLAARFAARRAKRSGDKSSTSLTSRLRNLGRGA